MTKIRIKSKIRTKYSAFCKKQLQQQNRLVEVLCQMSAAMMWNGECNPNTLRGEGYNPILQSILKKSNT